jgi:hypothetical protein
LYTVTNWRRLVTNTPSGLVGFDVPDDDRQFQVVNYHIPALKKNVSTSVKKLTEGSSQLACVTCPEQHFFTGSEPVVVIISDQHFPPSLPSNCGQCTVVIRCEDAMLFELPGLLREFFAGADGRISLPEGSVVLYGSLSHLAARGLDNYADEVVRTGKTIGSMVGGRGVTTAHNICVPLGGICSTGLIRMMLDLDCWLQSGDTMSPYSLARSRNKLWDLLLEHGNIMDTDGGSSDKRIYYLPESTTSNRKIRFIAPALALGLPTKLSALSPSKEIELIGCFLGELNEVFGFTFDTAPDLSRNHTVMLNSCKGKRVILIGASHTKRMAGSSAFKNHTVVDLSVPGWKPDTKNIEKLRIQLAQVNPGSSDFIVIDPLSNSAFCGTGDDGAPVQLSRDSNGKYHCPGSLSVITSHMIKKAMSSFNPVVETLKLFIISPVLRYVSAKCCEDQSHIDNFGTRGLQRDLINGLENILELIQGWGEHYPEHFEIIDTNETLVPSAEYWAEAPFNGEPLWQPGNPVHLLARAYDELATKVAEVLLDVSDEADLEPMAKRQRLESVVVTVKGPAAPALVPKAAPAVRPGWSSGEIVKPASERGHGINHRGRVRPYNGGRSGYRGQARGPYRGQKRFFPW